MKLPALLLISALGLTCPPCFADARDFGEGTQNFSEPSKLDNTNGSRDHWNGIGRLSVEGSVCTATLIDNRDDTSPLLIPAYVLTAGHCIDHSNGKIITNKPISGSMTFNYFTDGNKNKSYPLKQVKWRSMQGVDMAIVELNVSMHRLSRDGIQPLKVARVMPPEGSNVLIVGAAQYSTLQMSACTLQPASDVIEGRWTWRNNFMTQCKGVGAGISGSPLLDRYTNEIIGVIGTGNDDSSLTPCEINAPCTPTENGYQAIAGNVYGNPANIIKSCFRNGVMAETPAECRLYPTFSIAIEDDALQQPKVIKTTSNGETLPPTWNFKFSIDTDLYRHKTVRTAKDCENRSDYSGLVRSTLTVIDTEIGSQPGRYFLCILGMSRGQDFSLGLLRNALSVPIVLTDR